MSQVETAASVVWLQAKLAKGPRRRNELATEANGAGLSWPAVEAAKATLELMLVVQGGARKTAGHQRLAWATKQQCEELDLEVWRPGSAQTGTKQRAAGNFHRLTVQESLRARGQRVMDDSHKG